MKINMKVAAFAAAVVIGMTAFGTTTQAGDVEAGIDFATAYVFRGGTLNDSFVAQPYVEVGGLGGVTLGTWANFDLDDNSGGSPEGDHFSEIDLYVSYALPIEHDMLSLSVGYTEYTYPRAGGSLGVGLEEVDPVDADREFNIVAELDTIGAPSVGVYYGVDGAVDGDTYVEVGLSHEEALDEASGLTGDVGATMGIVTADEGGSDGISHIALNAGLAYEMISVGIGYIIETDDEVLEVDEDLVGTIGISHAW